MPQGDGTGPEGKGPIGNRNFPSRGFGRGRNKGGSYGTGGYCVCAKCGQKIPHQRGTKCTSIKCPSCGTTMIREELLQDRQTTSKNPDI